MSTCLSPERGGLVWRVAFRHSPLVNVYSEPHGRRGMALAGPVDMTRQNHLLGCFKTVQGARLAADRLEEEGVPKEALGILLSPEAREHLAIASKHTKLADGAAAGGVTGGVLGAIVAGVTTVAAIAAPGVGVLAAGPLVAMLAGAGVGAAAGGTVGGLIGLGLSETELTRVSDIITDKGVVVTVSSEDRKVLKTAHRVLDEMGAVLVRTGEGQVAQV